MDCPVCKEAMIVMELDEVEIDHCLECKGVWLDSGELKLLLKDSAARDQLLSSFEPDNTTRERPRKCPICLKRMEKVLCGTDHKVLIDRCKNKDGLWFDAGELDDVLDMGSCDKNNNVLNLLRDMFGKKT